jgi:hypothetical protein
MLVKIKRKSFSYRLGRPSVDPSAGLGTSDIDDSPHLTLVRSKMMMMMMSATTAAFSTESEEPEFGFRRGRYVPESSVLRIQLPPLFLVLSTMVVMVITAVLVRNPKNKIWLPPWKMRP